MIKDDERSIMGKIITCDRCGRIEKEATWYMVSELFRSGGWEKLKKLTYCKECAEVIT